MRSLSQTQKIILLILAVLDFAVIGGLAAIVIGSMRQPAKSRRLAPTPTNPNPAATWTPIPTMTPRPTPVARPTNTPTPTKTLIPTVVPTETPTPTPVPLIPVKLEGADFDFLLPNRIPGWEWDAYVNYKGGDEYNTETSYAEPLFTTADDPVRRIQRNHPQGRDTALAEVPNLGSSDRNRHCRQPDHLPHQGRCLLISRHADRQSRHRPHRTGQLQQRKVGRRDAHQPGQRHGHADLANCGGGPDAVPFFERKKGKRWNPPLGRVTVCFYAEPAYPHINNAAFFDQAELIVAPPR